MRLHHLTATAFGPFADTVSVDFEELNDAGLFLLTGPTGAGKSSLLDAVCFALYGQVPGARGVKTLKSQHAGPDARPEVVLDFSVRDRRFVVRRTPEWSRPKKRGDGFTPEKAAASITETTHGEDHFLSSRAAEVGLLINDLMGMTADQFVQVALLPQGEFQRFLRASSQERHDVLQHLFRTNRFARIEDWVHEHSRGLKDRSGRDQADVQRLADAVADRSGTELPEDLSADGLPAAAGDGRLLAWAAACRDEASTGLATATDESARARAGLDEATRPAPLRRARPRADRATDRRRGGAAHPGRERRRGVGRARRAVRCRARRRLPTSDRPPGPGCQWRRDRGDRAHRRPRVGQRGRAVRAGGRRRPVRPVRPAGSAAHAPRPRHPPRDAGPPRARRPSSPA